MAALIFGVAFGFALKLGVPGAESQLVQRVVEWVVLPGKLFLRVIQMVVIPLVFASVVRGIGAGQSIHSLKALGLKLVLYFLMTTVVALLIGVFIALSIKPGRAFPVHLDMPAVDRNQQLDAAANRPPVSDMIISLLPENPLAAMGNGELLQVVLFAVIVGLALLSMNEVHSKLILDLLAAVQEVCMTIVNWAMRLAPIAVFGMMLNTIVQTGVSTLISLSVYMGTVLLGLFVMGLVYLLFFFLATKKSPLIFLRKILPVQLLAFSTSSSAAVMPLSLKTAEEELGVSESTARLTIPLGATINMDGTALYQMIATIYLAQAFSVDLTTSQLVVVGITAVGSSVGAPGTPGVGIVILATILQSVGIPVEGVSLIIAVDRLLDMSRTAINVTGDLTASVVMDRLMGKKSF